MNFEVLVCCNDPHNGAFTGYFDAVHIYRKQDCILQLSHNHPSYVLKGTRIKMIDKKKVRIGKEPFWYLGHTNGIGNWCWDSYVFTGYDLARLLRYLHDSPYWSVDEGLTSLFNKWKNNQEISEADLSA